MDINESVLQINEKSGIGRILTEMDLIDLQQYRFPNQPRPPTYNRGQLTIDVSLGSPEFAQALKQTALLPFGQPVTLRGDHRTLVLEFDRKLLFGNNPLLHSFHTTRGTNSRSLPIVQKFCRLVTQAYDLSNIPEQITSLEQQERLTPIDRQLLETIDRELTTILIQADQKCRKYAQPWSPELHLAYLIHRYWALKVSSIKTKRKYTPILEKLQAMIGPTNTQLQPNETPSIKLRRSRQHLRVIRKQATQKQQQFLNELLVAAQRTKNKARSKLIYGLKQAEENRRCFALVRQALKPQKGGLTHVLIPWNNPDQEWEKITDVDTMEMHLLNQGKQHFQKAEGTPYTTEPLKTLLGNDGLTEFGTKIHRGEPIDPDLQIDPTTRLLLENQRNAIPQLLDRTHPMPFEAVIQCFKKWPEKTATSPSGRHLGIYKTLLKDQHHEQPGEPVTTKGIDLMQDIH